MFRQYRKLGTAYLDIDQSNTVYNSFKVYVLVIVSSIRLTFNNKTTKIAKKKKS